MIDKFIKNQMTEEEIDNMMFSFFETKKKKEFKEHWNSVLEDHIKSKKKGRIISLTRKIASVAAVLLIVGITSVLLYNNKVSPTNSGFTYVSKGGDKDLLLLEKQLDESIFAYVDSPYFNKLYSLYKQKKYKAVIDEVDNMLMKTNKKIGDNYLMLAGYASIRLKSLNKAKVYFSAIDETSPHNAKAKQLLRIINRIIK